MAFTKENCYYYELFIDELGTANTKDVMSELFILAGCSVKNSERQNIKIWADRIKFKYWGHTNIVFHSREIGRRQGNFKIFKNPLVYKNFLKDLESFLGTSNFKMFFVIVDKKKAKKLAWNSIKIFRETSFEMIRNFLLILLTGNSKGKIIAESASAEKDFYLHKAVGHFLAEGIKNPKVANNIIQETLTSVSFVTKKNHDIEEQIADLFAYGARCKYLLDKNRKIKKGLYEKMILKVLKSKIFEVPKESGIRKRQYFDKVNSFLVLPKNE